MKQKTVTAQQHHHRSDEVAIGYVSVFGELHLFDTGLRVG